MLRICAIHRLSLPFDPMALTTLDFLNSQLQRSPQQLADEEGIDAFKFGHFFISPKHDGVRVVSYVDVSRTSSSQSSVPMDLGMPKGSDLVAYNQRLKTCFSRHGRPIWGMQWIEQELNLLRALAGDPYLVLDGELYLHKNGDELDGRKTEKKEKTAFKNGKIDESIIPSTEAETPLLTGFLAVASLVHRLRGKLRNPTARDVLQYVTALPLYCLFDVASYSPMKIFPEFPLGVPLSWHNKIVYNELKAIQGRCLRENAITDIRTLHVVPNVTPFSSRLRTLGFLASLLKYGKASKILSSSYCPWYEQEAASHGSKRNPFLIDRKGATACSTSYLGGRFVKIIPYSLCNSLQDAQAHFLQKFIEKGFEGAVIRTPLNVYAMREKRKGIVAKIVGAGCYTLENSEGRTPRKTIVGSSSKKNSLAVCTIAKRRQAQEDFKLKSTIIREQLLASAIQKGKKLPRRSSTAVKLLLYKDDEFPVLKPLFKEPSLNPRTRQLAELPKSAIDPNDKVKKLSSSNANGSSLKGTGDAAKSFERMKHPHHPERVSFFGLQCLASNGRVFNVTLPKLSMEKQVQLLRHLQDAPKGKKSLTGLYVTVKYSTLTEHGIPRFGTVKAIRGGKGWFL